MLVLWVLRGSAVMFRTRCWCPVLWHLSISRDLSSNDSVRVSRQESLVYDNSLLSLSPLLSSLLSLLTLCNSSTCLRVEVQRTFSQPSQTLIRRGARDEITLGFGMSSSSSPEAVRPNILTCYNNFLWADHHWFDINGSNRLHQELSWRAVDSFNPTMKNEWAIISKGELDPACICINTPEMT